MKKHILFLGLLLIVFGFRLDAQTLKNIHRHNQPVLRIPTHLIDKVETAEVNGAQVLQVRQLNGYVSEIPLSQIDSITHSEGEAVDPAQLGNLRYASVMGVVTGPTGAPEMNAIVRSPYGGEETRTDPNGVFFLNNILVYDKLGYITITKPGFHQGSRSFLPLETGSNRVNVQLLPMTESGSFNATSGGTVTSGLLQLNFPANAVTLNGQPYTGIVRVNAAALDPTSASMFDQMPGELLGGMNDSLRILRSFGMASVELRDANMNELQLANGVSATLTFNIPASLQAEAPTTIDWWSFDEAQGLWMHEGVAQKQGNQYIGQASHFSWWNCDVPQNFNDLHGSVNTSDGTPISDAQVNVVTPNLGTGITYTNAEGVFSGRVPKNQLLELSIYLKCNSTNNWDLVYSDNIISESTPINSSFSTELGGLYPISGAVVDCLNNLIDNGYLKIENQIYITNNGLFNMFLCQSGTYVIQGIDASMIDSIKSSIPDTINITAVGADLGSIQACLSYNGLLVDIEGNFYKTILIGSQLWMSENLRTSRFSNGVEVQNVSDYTEWFGLQSSAWCNYNNSVSYDSFYGKLYNWYVVSDTLNICPVGWHIPSLSEFNQLRNTVGSSNTGGKLKLVTSWNLPNSGATNQSGFSGIGGGRRSSSGGVGDFNLNSNGYLWSNTEYSTTTARVLGLFYDWTGASVESVNKSFGLSIRCLKD